MATTTEKHGWFSVKQNEHKSNAKNNVKYIEIKGNS